MPRSLILVLGDQLSVGLSSLKRADPDTDTVLLAEVMAEATYVRHHKKKLVFLFSAMRHFADELRNAGWSVEYRTIAQTGPSGSFTSELERAIAAHGPERILVTAPGEWRVLQEMQTWEQRFRIPVAIVPDDRFLCPREEFEEWARGRRQLRMEHFYRHMRRRTGLLMDGDEPAGGRWNFDAENRKPAQADLLMPRPLRFERDALTNAVMAEVNARFADHFGHAEPFWFAVRRIDAEAALDHFIERSLPLFGDFQDAMLTGEPFLYHSLLSAYLNCGLLDPLDVCRRVETAYRKGAAPLNAAEGYIRQIIGWREYVRGVYWLKMPTYLEQNALDHHRPLPDFYWTGETDMACMRAAITQTRDEAYAHHIQRLMVTGNFALLAGIEPRAVHEWYLLVYADAYEWVELPNTLGMSQFADGGFLASKPYAASGAYINRMSDYCKGCRYDPKHAVGANACPFNSLYWHFLERHRSRLQKNPRMAVVYKSWDGMAEGKRTALVDKAADILERLDSPADAPRV